MDSRESASRSNDEYYSYSPLGIFSDSYFTNPVQYDERNTSFPPVGLRTEGFGASVPQQGDYQPYQTQTPMDLHLLSAERYQEGIYPHRSPRARGSGSIELYGGLLAMSPNEIEPTSPPMNMKPRRSKKETSKSTSADESGTRQRGRPRLDTRDQTAAERRRTQIRLAQRAYRQRKETTISGLNERVASLEKTIEDMNKTLLEFNDLAIAAGIEQGSPFLARSLGSTVKRFEELAKNVTHESGFEEDEENPVLSAEQFVVDQPRPSNPRRRAAASKTHPAVLGYQTTLEEEADDYDGEIAQQDLATQAQLENLPDSSDWTSTEAMQHYQVEMPDPTSASEAATLSMQQHRIDVANIANTTEDSMTTFSEKSPYGFYALPLPKSYSHQETSFARRLLRSAVEDSYRIMTDPTSRPEDKRRLCKFTWCFTNSSKVVEHLEKIIAKTAKDNLERWEVPQLHLGGAGLHYPRVGIDAGGAPPAWWANDAPMGPWPVGQPETPPVPNSMAISQIIRKAGVDGEWFDSNDVEQYLRRKGLLLDGQSQVVEITETDDLILDFFGAQPPSASSPGASSSKESSLGPHSPQNLESLWSSDPFLQSADCLWNEDVTSIPEIPDVNMDFSYPCCIDPKDFVPSLEFNMDPMNMPTSNTKMKKFVDVEKFLNSMLLNFV